MIAGENIDALPRYLWVCNDQGESVGWKLYWLRGAQECRLLIAETWQDNDASFWWAVWGFDVGTVSSHGEGRAVATRRAAELGVVQMTALFKVPS